MGCIVRCFSSIIFLKKFKNLRLRHVDKGWYVLLRILKPSVKKELRTRKGISFKKSIEWQYFEEIFTNLILKFICMWLVLEFIVEQLTLLTLCF